METMMLSILVLSVAIGILAGVMGSLAEKRKLDQLNNYWDVEIGMTENELLSIMGSGYNRSLLKNNRVKYEWRINAKSYGTYHKGWSKRSYTGVKKVTIYTRNGYVEEIKPYNV